MSIKTRPALPQEGRHPLLVVTRKVLADAHAGTCTIFSGKGVGRVLLRAADHAWTRGPAAAFIYRESLMAEAPTAWTAMGRRVLAGCGAGYRVDDGCEASAWLPAAEGAAPADCAGAAPDAAGTVTLIVGDVRARAAATMPDWPFISVVEGGCSHWLAEQTAPYEHRLCWVNAYTPSFEVKPAMYALAAFKWRRVLSLGNHATRACTAVGLDPTRVHHPLHWWNNYRDRPYKLVSILKEMYDE